MDITHTTHLGKIKTYKSLQTRYYLPHMERDAHAVSENGEYCIKYNPKPNKDSLVIPEVSVDNLRPMDHLGLDPFKHEGKNYLVIADCVK